VGFELYVWHESQPIGPVDATQSLDRWAVREPDVFPDHPALPVFRDALRSRFPDLQTDIEAGVVAIEIPWLSAAEISDAVLDLAAEHGLVCYDPALQVVNPNAPGYVPRFTLLSQRYPEIPDPDARRLEAAVRRLGENNSFTVLDRCDGAFVQVGYGPAAGAPAGAYVLEFSDGNRHVGSRTPDADAAVRLLQEFLAGEDGFQHRHDWRRLEI
jgi:hypothetical protein